MAGLPVKIKDEDVLDSLRPDIDKARAIQDELSVQRAEYLERFYALPYGNERTGWSQSVAPVISNNLNWSLPSLMEIFHAEYFTLKGGEREPVSPPMPPPGMPPPGMPPPPPGMPPTMGMTGPPPAAEPMSAEDRANNFQKLIYYQMYRKQDGYRRAYDFLYDAYLYHYAIFKVCYREDFDIVYDVHDRLSADEMMALVQEPGKTVTKYEEVQDDLGGTVYEKVKTATKKVNYAGPALECVHPSEFYYSPDCKVGDWGSIEGRLVYHEVTRTMNDIRKREQAGIYRKGSYTKVLESPTEGAKAADKQDTLTLIIGADAVSSHDTEAPESNELSKEVQIRECFYRLDIDGDGLLEPVIIDLCGEIILRLEENPYNRPPFRIGSVTPEPHKMTGIAMPKTLENDQKVMTNLLRLMQDSAAQSCYRNPVTNDQNMFKMLQDRKPFATILGPPDKLGEVKQAPPDQFILRTYEMMKGEIEEKTGNTRYNQGTDAASLNKTATGISAIFNASEKRMRLIAALMGNGPFMGVIRDFIFINQKWPGEDPIKLLGTKIVIDPTDLDGEYDIEVDIGTSPSDRQSTANQIDLFIQFGTQAGLQMGIIDEVGMRNAIKSKYRVLGINAGPWMVDEKTFKAKQAEKQKQQAPPDPNQIRMQMDQEAAKQKSQMEQQKAQMDMQVAQQKAQMEQQAQQAELQFKSQENQMQMQFAQAEFQQKMKFNEELHRQAMEQKQQTARQANSLQPGPPRPGAGPPSASKE